MKKKLYVCVLQPNTENKGKKPEKANNLCKTVYVSVYLVDLM